MKSRIAYLAVPLMAILTMAFVMPADWVSYETAGCKILFPKMPVDQSQTVQTKVGPLRIDIHMYEVPDSTKDDNKVYSLMETEYPDTLINSGMKEKLDKFFRASVDGAVSRVNGKLLSETPASISGYPGRKIKIAIDNGANVISMSFYLVRNKMYLLETVAAAGKDNNASSEKFLGSFTLKNP